MKIASGKTDTNTQSNSAALRPQGRSTKKSTTTAATDESGGSAALPTVAADGEPRCEFGSPRQRPSRTWARSVILRSGYSTGFSSFYFLPANAVRTSPIIPRLHR